MPRHIVSHIVYAAAHYVLQFRLAAIAATIIEERLYPDHQAALVMYPLSQLVTKFVSANDDRTSDFSMPTQELEIASHNRMSKKQQYGRYQTPPLQDLCVVGTQ